MAQSGPGIIQWMAYWALLLALVACPSARLSAQRPVDGVPPPTSSPAIEAVASGLPHASTELEAQLLAQAQAASRAGRLTLPLHDNAFDKFQSVLLINATSPQAHAGLAAILQHYVTLVRNDLRQGRLRTAGQRLQHVRQYYPDHTVVAQLRQQLNEARQQAQATKLRTDPVVATVQQVMLPARALGERSGQVTQLLAEVARRLLKTDESVMIHARNDREGRWIYKQLKGSAGGYRVRGDIRIDQVPKILFLPPL